MPLAELPPGGGPVDDGAGCAIGKVKLNMAVTSTRPDAERMSETGSAEGMGDGDAFRMGGSRTGSSGEYEVDPHRLINNSVSMALNVRAKRHLDIQRCLEELGIGVNDEAMGGTGSNGSFSPRKSTQEAMYPMNGSETSQEVNGRRYSVGMTFVPTRVEQELLAAMFQSPTTRYVVRDHHVSLGRVMQNIFPLGVGSQIQDIAKLASGSSLGVAANESAGCGRWRGARRWTRKYVEHSWFTGVFLVLTLYSLFSPDFVVIFGDKEVDAPYLIANAAVFVAFALELVLLLLGIPGYMCTLPFVLDVISLISVLSDTWFLRGSGWFDGQASRISRMARTSKMTRLARIARVARITKLIPKLLRIFRKHNTVLAKQVLMRRLWRVFLFLDTDSDGLVSTFDLKVFYTMLVTECPHLLFDSRLDVLLHDVGVLLQATCIEDELFPHIGFDSFHGILLNTKLGRNLVRFHLQDVEHETGVWTLTQRLSDNTALKVCVGILVLVTVISLLEIVIEDRSIEQSVAQLAAVARMEHAKGGLMNTTYLCQQIDICVSRMWDPNKHKVLFLHLDGVTHYDELQGGCLIPPENSTEPLERMQEIQALVAVRSSDLALACWPAACATGTVSASLVDRSIEARDLSKWAVGTMLMVILLLLIFVYVLNMKINMFSGNLLQPLRSLVDDMMAMSCLELVHIDEDMPPDKAKPVQMAEELRQLQTAFKSMRSAIRSWSKYVPPCVVERLYSMGIEATIGVSRCEATILFVDIASFEDACCGLSPEEVIDLLSNVFGSISDVIHKHKGTLLEFIGSEVLAVFNAPSALKHHALAGLRSTQEIHQAVDCRSQVQTAEGSEVFIRCRCGVHTGNILAGNIGSHKRMKYGLLGDGVNLAARLKGLNSRYGTMTLCSETVLDSDDGLARRLACTRPVDCVVVKGRREPTTVHEVMALARGDVDLALAAREHDKAFQLYQERDFEGAGVLFAEVSRLFEAAGQHDEPSGLLHARCLAYILAPPADWDGVDRLNRKSFRAASLTSSASLSLSGASTAGPVSAPTASKPPPLARAAQRPGDTAPLADDKEEWVNSADVAAVGGNLLLYSPRDAHSAGQSESSSTVGENCMGSQPHASAYCRRGFSVD